MVSINSNDPSMDHERGRAALKKFDALVDRRLLGKHWCKFDSKDRTFMFAVPEYAGGELHFHILVKFPLKRFTRKLKSQTLSDGLTETLRDKWIFPHGDAHVMRLTSENELEDSWLKFCAACYVVKGLWNAELWDHCIISSEFHR